MECYTPLKCFCGSTLTCVDTTHVPVCAKTWAPAVCCPAIPSKYPAPRCDHELCMWGEAIPPPGSNASAWIAALRAVEPSGVGGLVAPHDIDGRMFDPAWSPREARLVVEALAHPEGGVVLEYAISRLGGRAPRLHVLLQFMLEWSRKPVWWSHWLGLLGLDVRVLGCVTYNNTFARLSVLGIHAQNELWDLLWYVPDLDRRVLPGWRLMRCASLDAPARVEVYPAIVEGDSILANLAFRAGIGCPRLTSITRPSLYRTTCATAGVARVFERVPSHRYDRIRVRFEAGEPFPIAYTDPVDGRTATLEEMRAGWNWWGEVLEYEIAYHFNSLANRGGVNE